MDDSPPRWRSLGATSMALGVVLAFATGPTDEPPSSRAAAAVPTVVATPSPTPSAAPSPSPTPTPTVAPKPLGPPAPLTGLTTLDAELLDRRVVAVKIDNHANARPQTGINVADGVIELPVESGLTRFIALFHTSDLPLVGPVRSGRPTDPTLVRPLDATLLISGAQPWIVDVIRRAGVPLFVDIGEGVTFRSRDRFAPHNLYADTGALRLAADARGIADDAPRPWFQRPDPSTGDDGSTLTDGRPARRVELPWSDETTVVWDLVDDRWERTHNGARHATVSPEGDEEVITADHLIVIAAPRYTARNPVDGGGLPALDTVGEGRAWVVAGGDQPGWIEATWSRSAPQDLPVLVDADGDEVVVPAGRLWVSWMPAGRDPVFDPDVDRS